MIAAGIVLSKGGFTLLSFLASIIDAGWRSVSLLQVNSSLPPFTASGFAEDQAVRIREKTAAIRICLPCLAYGSGDTILRVSLWAITSYHQYHVYSKPLGEYSRVLTIAAIR